MIKIENILSEKEIKTRDRWLFWLIKIPVAFVLATFAFLIFSLGFTALSTGTQGLVSFFAIIGVLVVALGLSFYLPYHCCYLKHGTKFLTFMLIVMPLSQAYDYTSLFLSWGEKNILFLIPGTTFAAFSFYLSWKLLGSATLFL